MLYPARLMLLVVRCSVVAVWSVCAIAVAQQTERLSDDDLLTAVQERTFDYFWDGAEQHSGWALERIHLDEPEVDQSLVTSGGTGFGVMAILVGVERNFVQRASAVERLEKILDFAERADRFHGAWPHWLLGESGRVKPFSPNDDGADLVETSFLAQGLICVRQYFADGNEREQRLARQADQLWREIEWEFFRGPNRENVLYWHWSPRVGWEMNFPIRGYNECMITYVLAGCSPTHSISSAVYSAGWAENGAIADPRTYLGVPIALKHQGILRSCGPLFWAHYSFLGLDPRGLKDRYADYWEHNRAHVQMIHAHCVENPGNFPGYGEACWGLTSSYSINFYNAHSPENDNGTISPTAALSSFPYEPQYCMEALRYFYEQQGERLFGKYGFYDAFNLQRDWFPQRYLAIDQGPMVIMIENYRSGLLWELFMSAPEVQRGLANLGIEFRTRAPMAPAVPVVEAASVGK